MARERPSLRANIAKPDPAEESRLAIEQAAALDKRRPVAEQSGPLPPDMVTTAIHISKRDLALLRRVAVERANLNGGRPSVSDVLRELVERHRDELVAETGR